MAYKRNNEKEYVQSFWKYFMYYAENSLSNSTNDKVEIQKELEKDIDKFTTALTKLAPLRSNYIRFASQKFFAQNPVAFIETYQQIMDYMKKDPDFLERFNPYNYSYNKEFSHGQFLIELIRESRETNPELPPNSKEELKALRQNLLKCDSLFEKRSKKLYIDLLVAIGNLLKKFNLIEYSAEKFRHKVAGFSLLNLSYPAHDTEIEKLEKIEKETDQIIAEEKKAKKKELTQNPIKEEALSKTISIDTLFTENYLNTLTLPKLIALAAFWTNRAVKHIRTLNEMIFVVNELDLWENLSTRKKRLAIEPTQLSNLLKKTMCLTKFEDEVFGIMENIQFEQPELSQTEINKIFNEHFDAKVKKEEGQYKTDFDLILPDSQNNLNNDLTKYHLMSNTIYLLYRLKDMCIFNLLMGCIDHGYSKNWGILPESDETDKEIVCFDIEGLNMPVRLHVYTSELTEFLEEFTSSPVIPLYQGIKDFELGDELFGTIILAPICKKQNTCIKKELADPRKLLPYKLNYLRHIQFLKDSSKLPPSLKNENLHNAKNLRTGENIHITTKVKNK